MVCEISVTIKGEDKRLTTKHLCYDKITVEETDPTIKSCIDQTLKNFDGTPDSISVSIKMELA
jgi:hypothetical protein